MAHGDSLPLKRPVRHSSDFRWCYVEIWDFNDNLGVDEVGISLGNFVWAPTPPKIAKNRWVHLQGRLSQNPLSLISQCASPHLWLVATYSVCYGPSVCRAFERKRRESLAASRSAKLPCCTMWPIAAFVSKSIRQISLSHFYVHMVASPVAVKQLMMLWISNIHAKEEANGNRSVVAGRESSLLKINYFKHLARLG